MFFFWNLYFLMILSAYSITIAQNQQADLISVSRTHFGKKEDFQGVNLPQVKENEFNITNPNAFTLTNDGSGNYYFQFNTDGLERYEIGELKNPGADNEVQVVRGQYKDRYYTEDGTSVDRTIGYIADENGYRPFLISIDTFPLTYAGGYYSGGGAGGFGGQRGSAPTTGKHKPAGGYYQAGLAYFGKSAPVSSKPTKQPKQKLKTTTVPPNIKAKHRNDKLVGGNYYYFKK